MPLPLIPESICIMLMTNINCFLIIMNQKYGKELAGGEIETEKWVKTISGEIRSRPDILIVCFLPDWPRYFLRSVSV